MAKFSATSVKQHNRAAVGRLVARARGYESARINKAAALAVASTRRRFEPAAKRQVRQDYGVRAGALTGKFRVMSGADEVGEYVAIAASTRRLSLMEFGARWGGRARARNGGWTQAASAAVRRGQRKVYESAFIATLNGQRRVLVRQRNRATGKRDPRNRLRSVLGPSPWLMLEGMDGAADALRRQMATIHQAEFRRQLERLGARN